MPSSSWLGNSSSMIVTGSPLWGIQISSVSASKRNVPFEPEYSINTPSPASLGEPKAMMLESTWQTNPFAILHESQIASSAVTGTSSPSGPLRDLM